MTTQSTLKKLNAMLNPEAAHMRVYKINLKLKIGFRTVKLESDRFKDSSIAAVLKENGVKSSDGMVIYENIPAVVEWGDTWIDPATGEEISLDWGDKTNTTTNEAVGISWARHKVQAGVEALQKKYLKWFEEDSAWMISEADYPAFDAELRIVKYKLQFLLNELIRTDTFTAALNSYSARVNAICAVAGVPEYATTLMGKFPSAEQLRDSFRLVTGIPQLVPSLIENIQNDTALLEQIAAQQAATAQQEVIRATQEGIVEFQAGVRNMISDLRDEIFGHMAEALNQLERAGSRDVSQATRNRLVAHVERLESMNNLLSGLTSGETSYLGLAQATSELAAMIQPGGDRENLADRLVEMRQRLQSDLAGLDMKAGDGHRKLGAFMILPTAAPAQN